MDISAGVKGGDIERAVITSEERFTEVFGG
jgi:hypothetical protein